MSGTDDRADAKRLERNARLRERYNSDPEYRFTKLARMRAYGATHRVESRLRQQRWRACNQEHDYLRKKAWRARQHTHRVELTDDQWQFTLRYFRHRCVYCDGAELLTDRLTLDHVDALTRGGHHAIGNVAPAHHSCNSSKCDSLLEDWLKPGCPYTAAELRTELEACALAWDESQCGESDAAASADDAPTVEFDPAAWDPAITGWQ